MTHISSVEPLLDRRRRLPKRTGAERQLKLILRLLHLPKARQPMVERQIQKYAAMVVDEERDNARGKAIEILQRLL